MRFHTRAVSSSEEALAETWKEPRWWRIDWTRRHPYLWQCWSLSQAFWNVAVRLWLAERYPILLLDPVTPPLLTRTSDRPPVVSKTPKYETATIRTLSISTPGAQQPRANRASTKIAFRNCHESLLSSSLGKGSVEQQPALYPRDEQNRPSEQIQTA
jgi:hypothetical protein